MVPDTLAPAIPLRKLLLFLFFLLPLLRLFLYVLSTSAVLFKTALPLCAMT